MKEQRGFSLIELLIVVAIIGIIAAIAIPALLQAKLAANQAAAKQDGKALLASQASYEERNGDVGAFALNLQCLATPVVCPVGTSPGAVAWPATEPPFTDPQMGAVPGIPGTVAPGFQFQKKGYLRTYIPGPPPLVQGTHSDGAPTWAYRSDPIVANQSDYYMADSTGVTCSNPSNVGPVPGPGANGLNIAATCKPI